MTVRTASPAWLLFFPVTATAGFSNTPPTLARTCFNRFNPAREARAASRRRAAAVRIKQRCTRPRNKAGAESNWKRLNNHWVGGHGRSTHGIQVFSSTVCLKNRMLLARVCAETGTGTGTGTGTETWTGTETLRRGSKNEPLQVCKFHGTLRPRGFWNNTLRWE